MRTFSLFQKTTQQVKNKKYDDKLVKSPFGFLVGQLLTDFANCLR
jgi:hypothetical protein